MNQGRYILKLTSIYGLGNLVRGLLMFLLLPVLTKSLEVADYGIYSLLYVLRSFGVIVILMGIHSSIFICYYTGDENSKDDYFHTSLLLIVLSAVACAILSFVLDIPIARAIGDGCKPLYIVLTGITIAGEAVQQVYLSFLRVKDRAFSFGVVQIVKLLGILGLTYWLVGIRRMGLDGAVYGALIPTMLITGVLFIVNFDYFGLKIDRDAAGKLIRLGFPLMVTVLLSWGINLADRFLINSILNDHQQVAIYNFAATIGRVPYFIIVAPFAVAWATVMFHIAKMENPLDRFREYFTFFVALNLLCGSVLLLFRKELLYLLAKNDYASGLNMISWFILGSTFGGLYSFWTFGPALKGRSREYVFPALFSALVTILGNSLLLRYYGIVGGAYTYIIANFCMAYIMYYICQKWYPVSYDWAKVSLLFLIFIFIWMANENIVIFLNNTARILGQVLLFALFLAICWNMTLRKLYILSFSSSLNSAK